MDNIVEVYVNHPIIEVNTDKIVNLDGGVWGVITGDLENQTDLQTALNTLNTSIDNAIISLNQAIALKEDLLGYTAENITNKGVANGYASLDNSGKVPQSQLDIAFSQINSDWDAIDGLAQILNRPNLADVAISGDYGDLNNIPNIPVNVSDLANDSGFITSNIVTSVAAKTGDVTLTKSDVGLGDVDNTSDSNKPVSTAVQTALNLKQSALGFAPENTANKNISGGYAGLDSSGLIPPVLLPSFVDDVVEFANLSSFPATGETGKIYVALDTNKTHRWSGSTYIEISASPGSTDVISEGSTNLYFTQNRVRNTLLTGVSFVINSAIAATDSLLTAFGKLQAQINVRLISGNNLSDLTDVATARNNLELGSLATQNGTSSGTNTGDVSIGTANGLGLAVQTLSLGLASGATTGALNSTDWDIFNNKEPSVALGTTAQYWRGDKSWQALNGTAVGLNNVVNLDTSNPANIIQSASYRFVSDTEKTTWNNKQSALGYTPENIANRNQINGYAGLDGSGLIPPVLLPSFVDDVLEFANLAAFPITGETGKIYVALDTNKTYRWSGSVYVEISASPGSTDAVTEGSINLYFTENRVRSALLTGISFVINSAVTAADSLLVAFGKLQAQINARLVGSNNLSDLTNIATARTNLELGTLATQSGSFSGTSSGGNTGDETTSTIRTKLGVATTSADGYLISTDWNTFNSKQSALGFTAFNKAGDSLTATDGTGIIGLLAQAATPSTPGSGFKLFANSANAFSWRGQNTFTRTFDGTSNTADRIYTLPNASGNIVIAESIPNGAIINGVCHIYQSSTPTLRPGINGGATSALVIGDIYRNTSNGKIYFWNGVYWQNVDTRTIGFHTSAFSTSTATFTQAANVSFNQILLSAFVNRISFTATSTNNGNIDLELVSAGNGVVQTITFFNNFTDATTVGLERSFSTVLNTAVAGTGNPFLRIKLNNATGTSPAASGQFAIGFVIAEIL